MSDEPETLGAGYAYGREVFVKGKFVGKALSNTDAIEIARAITALAPSVGDGTPGPAREAAPADLAAIRARWEDQCSLIISQGAWAAYTWPPTHRQIIEQARMDIGGLLVEVDALTPVQPRGRAETSDVWRCRRCGLTGTITHAPEIPRATR